MRVYSSKKVLLLGFVLCLIGYALPFFPRILLSVVSVILLPGYVWSHHVFKDKSVLKNATFGIFFSLLYLTVFGAITLTLLKGRHYLFFVGVYYASLWVVDFLFGRFKKAPIILEYAWESHDRHFAFLLLLLLFSVAFQSYFIGYETQEGFVSKFTRNDHWYYAASSAEVKNQGLDSYPTYPHLPPSKDRYPMGSFVLFGILSLLLNTPTLYVVQYLGILAPLGLSLVFYYGGQLLFNDKKAAFYTFLFGVILPLGLAFFYTPTALYRYQGLPVPGYVVPLTFLVAAVAVWLITKVHAHSKKAFYCLFLGAVALGVVGGFGVVQQLSTRLGASAAWTIPILYYEWTYDASFVGVLPLQVFFVTASPKALSFLYQALALLMLYQVLYEKNPALRRKRQGLLVLDIALMSVNHAPSFLPFAFFLGVLAVVGLWHKPTRPLVVPIVLGGLLSGGYLAYYLTSVAPGKGYLALKLGMPYPWFAFVVFYGFYWLFSYYGIRTLWRRKQHGVLSLLGLFVLSHWLYAFLVKNTFNPLDLGRVFTAAIIPLAFLSGVGVVVFNRQTDRQVRFGTYLVVIVMGICYFLVYPLNFSPLQPSQYLIPRADGEAHQWIKSSTASNAVFVVSLNESEYNSHELTVFGERRTLIDSPWNLKLYGYPSEGVDVRKALVHEVYASGLSEESLRRLRDHVDQALGRGTPLYVFIGFYELQRYPELRILAVDPGSLVYRSSGAVVFKVD